jgi:hypothetical protein
MPKKRHRRVRIEDAIRVTRGLELKDITRAHGRLILGTDGLFFVHGWDERRADDMGGVSAGQQLGGLELLIGAVVRAIMAMARDRANRWTEDVQQDGLRMLAEIQELPPKRQVARIAGSTHIPLDDIERVSFGWLKGLRVATAARGDEYQFVVPYAGRGATKAWVAAVARRSAIRQA